MLKSKTGTPLNMFTDKFPLQIIFETELISLKTVKHAAFIIGAIIFHPVDIENRFISVVSVKMTGLIGEVAQITCQVNSGNKMVRFIHKPVNTASFCKT